MEKLICNKKFYYKVVELIPVVRTVTRLDLVVWSVLFPRGGCINAKTPDDLAIPMISFSNEIHEGIFDGNLGRQRR